VEKSFGLQFLAAVERFPDRCALDLRGMRITFQQMAEAALQLAATLQRSRIEGPVGLLARDSVEAYQGVLGIFLSGAPYLPLTPENPILGNLEFLQRSECKTVLVDKAGWESFASAPESIRDVTILRMDDQNPQNGYAAAAAYLDLSATAADWKNPGYRGDAIAYIIFTSGSTGIPKGVRITNSNIAAAVASIRSRMQPNEHDRVAQTCELSFDGSLSNMLPAWVVGACLVPALPADILRLRNLIRESRMTIWGAVPSVAGLMRRLGMLEPNSFPDLRYSYFAGEAVTMNLLATWGSAAPNSIVDNLYGPTEATILCAGYRWKREPAATADGTLAPIGAFIGETIARVVNPEDLSEVEEGQPGELLLSGPQVSAGYLDHESTARSFICPFEPGQIYYRTGDLVRQAQGQFMYLGRMDHQVKVRGNRVELGEIEAQLKKLSKCDRAVALGWPPSPSGADGIVGFVEAAESSINVAELDHALREVLPRYMAPSAIIAVPRFPMNLHGKEDRAALKNLLETREAKKMGTIVLGVPRSGTTLLRRLLNGHPSLSCPGETFLLSACARFIQNDTMPNDISVGVLEGLKRLQIDPAQVLERLRSFFIEIHVTHAAAQGKTHWAEKSASDVFYLDQIEQLMGNHAQFVVLLRHGLDVAASLVELSERVGGYYSEFHRYVSQSQYPIEAFVRMWAERTDLLLDFAERRRSQVCLVRYEDLVSDTDKVMNTIFGFIGISEQAGIAERVLKNKDTTGIGDWKASQNTEVRTDRVGRWKRLSPAVIPKLARIANPVLERAGYAPINDFADDNGFDRDARYAQAARVSHLVPKGRSDGK
jgi:amino acid adenylation domain-containing protein